MRIQVSNETRESETRDREREPGTGRAIGGWTRWLVDRLRAGARLRPRLALVERITLAPRQSLALVEADGRQILVATSAEGGPAFFPLERESRRLPAGPGRRPSGIVTRVSW